MSLPTNDDIEIGDKVMIERKKEQGTGNLTEGIVKQKLTRGHSHPYGIKVELENGERGRVKKNLSRNVTANDHINKIVKIRTELKLLKEKKESQQKKSKQTQSSLINPDFIGLDKKNVPKTEDVSNEFKEFYQYDEDFEKWKNILAENLWKEKIVNATKEVKKRFCVSVASFGNSSVGGFLHLGVNSDGKIMGLERDKEFAKFSDYEDTFANSIRETLEKFLDDKIFIISKLRIKFTVREGKTICIFQILPSDKPIWVYTKENSNGEFFVRGSSPRAEFLNMKESLSYIKGRFPNFWN